MSRKVILYIAMSIDGYIAKPNDDLSFLSIVQKEGEDYGYGTFIQNIDTVILGRKTYDWVMTQVPEFPHADKETYVITRTEKASVGNTHFYTGNLKELITRCKAVQGKSIFIDGGSEIINALLNEQLIDEMILSLIPVVLGGGVRLFNNANPEQQFVLISSKAFDKGLVQLHYRKKIKNTSK